MILRDNAEALDPELRIHSTDDIESKTRTGMPTSLALHDMGLSTYISNSNVDANGSIFLRYLLTAPLLYH